MCQNLLFSLAALLGIIVRIMTTILDEMLGKRRFGIKPGLEAMRALLEELDHPEAETAAIHIAGTDGKGAVAAMCESVLRRAGYRVGRYTSPHLVRVNERFLVDGSPVSDEALEAAARVVCPAVERVEAHLSREVTFFECRTAVAFVLYRQLDIQLLVLETGLGGRLDATNVVTPLVSVITRIGLDHCEWLGDTVRAIAGEKAGIIKSGRPVVCGAMPDEARAVICETAATRGCLCVAAEDAVSLRVSKSRLDGQTFSISTQNRTLPPVRFPLSGAFQAENAVTAVAALECVHDLGLPIADEAFVEGLEQVCWPGRFQLVCSAPPVIIDGGHNPCAAEALLAALKSCREKRPVGLVAGFCGDKDVPTFLRTLKPVVKQAWGVTIRNPRSLPATETRDLMRLAGIEHAEATTSLEDALAAARQWAATSNGIVLVCGSLFLAGEALVACGAFPWPCGRIDPNEQTSAGETRA